MPPTRSTAAGWDAVKTAAPRHVAWVRQIFFSDIRAAQEADLADILSTVYENILREGTCRDPAKSAPPRHRRTLRFQS